MGERPEDQFVEDSIDTLADYLYELASRSPTTADHSGDIYTAAAGALLDVLGLWNDE